MFGDVENHNFHRYYYGEVRLKNQDEILTKMKKCDGFFIIEIQQRPLLTDKAGQRFHVLRENSTKIGKISSRPASISAASTNLLRSL